MGADRRKKVFMVPGFTPMDRAVGEVLEAADDVEVVYGLPDEDRWRRPHDSEDAERMGRLCADALHSALPDVHAIYAYGAPRVDGSAMARAHRLEVIFTPGAGYERIDLASATERGVACVNSSGVNATAVSDGAIGLMLAATMRLGYVDRVMHAQRQWLALADLAQLGMHPAQISGKTLGVVGYGFIGREVARKCRDGFRMQVMAYDPYFDPLEARRHGVTLADTVEEMLPDCDVVSVNCPLTPDTKGIIDEQRLRLMKPSAVLVNTSRGQTVDTDALVRALREAWIAAAALDVTDPEPLPAGHPLFELDNVVLSPHITGAADDTMAQLGAASATEALRILRGRRSFRMLNPQVWPALRERQQHSNTA